ncbi:MAG TPA: hypothetical protein VIX81_11295 [Gammaproteobacteria bacterium]
MSRFLDQDPDEHFPADAEDDLPEYDDEDDEDDGRPFDDDDLDLAAGSARVPVLDDVVVAGRAGPPRAWGDAPAEAEASDDDARRLLALVTEAVDLALDDALDRLRPELHDRLRVYLDQRLPELIAAALRARDERD